MYDVTTLLPALPCDCVASVEVTASLYWGWSLVSKHKSQLTSLLTAMNGSL